MSYILVEDFRSGLDRRKSIITAPAGSLYTLTNALITRGGEIQKRKAFAPHRTLPAGTIGLAATAPGGLYVFAGAAVSGVPPGITLQVLAGGPTLLKIDTWDVFAGKLYVVASYNDGWQRHFYNGVAVAAWAPGGTLSLLGRVTCVLTFKNKIYITAGSTLVCSAVGAPTDFTGTGSAQIDMSTQIGGAEALISVAPYQRDLAIFARSVSQVWAVDDDPAQNAQKQVLNNIGTRAPLGVTNFGDSDVFFIADSGVRSMKARDSSNSALVADVGVPIDGYIHDILANLTEEQRAAAIGLIDLGDGRYWLVLHERVFVFSFYPSSKISAWSEYHPGFVIEYGVLWQNRIYVRAGNEIYLYGGDSDQEYDTSPVEVILPYLDASKPATSKIFGAIDAALVGEWTVEVGTDPEQPETRDLVGIVNRSTFGLGRIDFNGEGTHIGIRLTQTKAERAQLSNLIIHFDGYKDD